ncbi:MAG TPA: hypothetical protein VMV94_02945 [Phycisphaerae bacterium]|nr:hypothetical protein [Phycisphaerae bacterium]
MQLLDWQYLIFLLPIAFGALYLLLLAAGLSGGTEAGDADASVDHDLAMDHGDVGVDHGDLAHGDIGHAHVEHAGMDQELHPGAFETFISFLGIGKVPVSILMMSYCFVWGVVGMASLTMLGEPSVGRAIAIAVVASIVVTRYLAIGIAKLVPSVESYSTPLSTLVGLGGEVLYAITDASGTVRVRDPQDNIRDVPCRVAPGDKSIPAGTKVVLFHYDRVKKVFFVSL